MKISAVDYKTGWPVELHPQAAVISVKIECTGEELEDLPFIRWVQTALRCRLATPNEKILIEVT